ncbi:Alpha/Beta hydrolase protein [Mycena maculata]|uniref:Alpha/Beta hydrolase protein n=1 Tax=Mycena maculata TaxID=230809 RepID=A0AAD7MU75_9AGAR|nr:Alpha/Beta hydrolase protein [Mycena maculata]
MFRYEPVGISTVDLQAQASFCTRCKFSHSLYSSLCYFRPCRRRSPSSLRRCTTISYFVLYTKYSSAAYQLIFPSPLGQTLVQSVSPSSVSLPLGFIAQDDTRQEIVVSFRGTSSIRADALTGIYNRNILIQAYQGTFLPLGFPSYTSVAEVVIDAVRAQVAKFPTYTLVVTGHSLGTAITALAAVDLKTAIPDATMKLYTFGQPRTGDASWAVFAESTIGVDNVHRAVHTFDGVPTMVPQVLGY